MAKRLYVGNIPYSVTDEQLSDMFTPYGAINEVYVVTDRFSGQAKGFAFVELADDAQADEAIRALNGTSMSGRTLVVSEARQRDSAPRGAARSGGRSDQARW
ncbi:MAG: RNA-binding protein [Chthonomonadales bacterium]|nr:RNA-binding protein [Chthonomonadales bacterium]